MPTCSNPSGVLSHSSAGCSGGGVIFVSFFMEPQWRRNIARNIMIKSFAFIKKL
jgi:hypothetical protein